MSKGRMREFYQCVSFKLGFGARLSFRFRC